MTKQRIAYFLMGVASLLLIAAGGVNSLNRFNEWDTGDAGIGTIWTRTEATGRSGAWSNWATLRGVLVTNGGPVSWTADENFVWAFSAQPNNAHFWLTNSDGVMFMDILHNLPGSTYIQFGAQDVYAKSLQLTNNVGGSTRWVGGTLFTQTNIVGLTNAGFKCLFDGIGTTNLPANFFEVGRSLVVDMEGKWLCANGDNWTNQVRLGGTMIASNLINSVQLPSVESDWRIRVRLTPIAIGASGRIRVSGGVTTVRDGGDAMATSGIPWTPSTVVTVDTTAALSFGVMSASSATAVDVNYIHVTGGTVKIE